MPDQHERLAHPQPVGEQPDDDQGDDVRPPEPGVEPVGLGDREVEPVGVLEGDRVVDGEEAGGGVVDEQEHRDAEGRADQVPLEDLAPWALGGGQNLASGQTAGPRFDQRPVPGRDHQLVAELGRQVLHEEQADDEGGQGGDARDDELAVPVLAEVAEGVGGDDAGDQAAGHRADGPEAHGRGPAELRAEVADQGRGGHQDGPLHQADGAR